MKRLILKAPGIPMVAAHARTKEVKERKRNLSPQQFGSSKPQGCTKNPGETFTPVVRAAAVTVAAKAFEWPGRSGKPRKSPDDDNSL